MELAKGFRKADHKPIRNQIVHTELGDSLIANFIDFIREDLDFSLIIAWNRFDNFFFFFPIFGLKQPDIINKIGYLLSGQGGLPSLHP